MQTELNFKALLHSKRANMFYLEHCRVMQKDGRVLYLTESKNQNSYWNIPIANTTVLLLGTGTSITQAAVRMLSSAGVVIGFCGGGGTPLLHANEIEWFTPQNEYRPTEYLQGWIKMWFDDDSRLRAAKSFQKSRIEYLKAVWQSDEDLQDYGFYIDEYDCEKALSVFSKKIDSSVEVGQLLAAEAEFTKKLYKFCCSVLGVDRFTRERDSEELTNQFLNHGNYLAYGSAACSLWTLGIPYAFAVMHGKTRRGALVFDVADLVKDAIILPYSFILANEKKNESEYRQFILQKMTEHKSLDFMFKTVKSIAVQGEEEETL